ncbi:3186_t:CDS:1, partial [Acaulospora colombiana]
DFNENRNSERAAAAPEGGEKGKTKAAEHPREFTYRGFQS